MKKLTALGHLVDAYLHEDFVDCHGSARGAVEDFVHDEPEHALRLRSEISYLLSRCQSEPEVESALVDLGICYLPTGDGWPDHRTWLLAVADHVDEILRKSPAA
jgi:hypothetical protein